MDNKCSLWWAWAIPIAYVLGLILGFILIKGGF